MIRLLMASTAIAAVIATATLAQDASSSSAMDSSMMDNASSSMSEMSSMPASTSTATPAPRRQIEILSGYTRADTDNLATKIIGRPVYDGTGTDASNLGSVTDLVVSEDGSVSAVIIGVGGFLGLGQKQVAVDFAALEWVVAADNTERYVLKTTKDELTQAPDFTTVDDQPGDASAVSDDGTMSSSSVAR